MLINIQVPLDLFMWSFGGCIILIFGLFRWILGYILRNAKEQHDATQIQIMAIQLETKGIKDNYLNRFERVADNITNAKEQTLSVVHNFQTTILELVNTCHTDMLKKVHELETKFLEK